MRIKWLAPVLLIVLLGTLGCGRVYRIESHSMKPTFDERQLVTIIPIDLDELARGDIIGYNNPMNDDEQYIKRLVGLPGDTVEIADGQLIINGEPLDEPYVDGPTEGRHDAVVLADDEYYVIGDNRPNSADSRMMGPLRSKHIIGKVTVTWWNRLTQD